jgi:hypothetical protein
MTTWKDSLERRDEVKAAFLEGWKERGQDVELDPERAWQDSQARARLEKPLA